MCFFTLFSLGNSQEKETLINSLLVDQTNQSFASLYYDTNKGKVPDLHLRSQQLPPLLLHPFCKVSVACNFVSVPICQGPAAGAEQQQRPASRQRATQLTVSTVVGSPGAERNSSRHCRSARP